MCNKNSINKNEMDLNNQKIIHHSFENCECHSTDDIPTRPRQGLNPVPLVLETNALPLRVIKKQENWIMYNISIIIFLLKNFHLLQNSYFSITP